MKLDQLTKEIIGSAIEVHRLLGPGLLESSYEECLAVDLSLKGIPFEKQKPMPLVYKGKKLECGYRLDFLVAGNVVVEVKAVDALLPVHHAQVLTYLKIGGFHVGLLINFHVPVLKSGLRRIVMNFDDNEDLRRLRPTADENRRRISK